MPQDDFAREQLLELSRRVSAFGTKLDRLADRVLYYYNHTTTETDARLDRAERLLSYLGKWAELNGYLLPDEFAEVDSSNDEME